MSNTDELLALLQEVDIDKLRGLTELMSTSNNKTKVPKEHGPVKQYTTIHMKHTCLLCGTQSTYTYELKKGDKISTIDSTGNGHTMTATGKAGEIDLASFNSRCHKCPDVMKTWTRDVLEARFLLLLKNSTFKEVVNYAAEVTNNVQ